jgi:hypothetical protein
VDELDAGGVDPDVVGGPSDPELVAAGGQPYTTRAALSHLLQAAEEDSRRVADIVNISSIAGRETPRMTDVCGVVNV